VSAARAHLEPLPLQRDDPGPEPEPPALPTFDAIVAQMRADRSSWEISETAIR